MKIKLFTLSSLLLFQFAKSQTLTLVQDARLYDHHSSTLTSQPYGYSNDNTLSGYDFVAHTNVPAGIAIQSADRDMVENNGIFGNGGNFGFTSGTSNIGTFGYQGNGQTKYQYIASATFSNINTVSDIMALYNSTLASVGVPYVAANRVYVTKIRNTDEYVAIKINTVSNLTPAEVNMLMNSTPFNADVFFSFDYKYGTYVAPPNPTGLNRESAGNKTIIVYPNPAKTQLNLSTKNNINSYRIVNMLGETVKEDSNGSFTDNSIDIKSLMSGVYFIEFAGDNEYYQRIKFIKE